MPSSAIESANEQVRHAQQASKKTTRKLSPEERAKIGKYACENGVAAASRHFSRATQLGKSLNESTIRGIKKVYVSELTRKRKAREELTITELSYAKRG